jgi:erythronate-4-phosphate dehydrogenase
MLIIADRNIACAEEAFGSLGELRLVDGRALTARDVRDADILLVRSVTRVNRDLLAGSKIRFVGSATIGADHIDLDYLRDNGITFAHAPGSNAQAVAEYVLSAILALHSGKPVGRLGIIGYGNTGSRLAKLLDVLGIETLVNDPPLQASGIKTRQFVALEEICNADIISLHVPLIRTGRFPTYHLVDKPFLQKLLPDCLLINTSRGAVVDNIALSKHLDNNRLSAVLDVWEGEPAINFELLGKTRLGTPHIAGYSLEGRLNGTAQIYKALCQFLNIEPAWQAPLPSLQEKILTTGQQGFAAISDLVLQAYDIRRDDIQLRSLMPLSAAERASGFDRLRRDYPVRREFSAYRCRVDNGGEILKRQLAGLGFVLEVH